MKIFIKTFLILILSVNNCFALFGAGDIVSDPTSYTYYAKEIKAMNDQIKTALDQVEILNQANKLIDTTNDLLFNTGEKIYNPATQIKNLVRNVQRIQSRFENTAERAKNMGVERFFKDYHNINEPLNNEAYKKWKDNLAGLFDNNEDEKYKELKEEILRTQKRKDYLAYQKAVENMSTYLQLKKKEQNGIKKASLKAPIDLYQEYFLNEKVVQQREERREALNDFMTQISSEKDMVKQQRITNSVLLYLLETIDKQYNMQMQFFYALSIPKYQDNLSSIDLELKNLKKEREKYRDGKSIDKTAAIIERDRFLKDLAKEGKESQIYDILSGKQDFYE